LVCFLHTDGIGVAFTPLGSEKGVQTNTWVCDVKFKSRAERFSELLCPLLFNLVVSLQVRIGIVNLNVA
jgi:hypothetical protein